MARALARLKPIEIPRLTKIAGKHCDGNGLYLIVEPPSQASWALRYRSNGKDRWMGLGPYPEVKLTDARERAFQARKLRIDGHDPLDARRREAHEKRLKDSKAMTFKQCGEAYIASQRAGWRNPKHAAQWTSTLEAYVYPLIGNKPVADIDADLVIQVLEQQVGPPENRDRFWVAKNETASRVRGRIEAILGWAAAKKLRSIENPARWQGQLSHLLPARSKVAKVEHHAALPYADIAAFLLLIRQQHGLSAKAAELVVLTAVRSTEALNAKWDEIDLVSRTWAIPAQRMKAFKEHRVPLSGAVITLLKSLKPDSKNADATPFVFPGAKRGKPLSNMAMLALLKRMKRTDVTIHGFRSTFRDWVAEVTNYGGDIAEMALAHTISNRVEAAYRRGDLYEKRVRLMEDWATYCDTLPQKEPPNEEAPIVTP